MGLFLVGVTRDEIDPPAAPAAAPPAADGAETAAADDEAGPLVYVIAGEPSGDALSARLMAALRRRLDGRVRFAGIGGEAMAELGLVSRLDQRELAIMGFFEVLPRALALKRRIAETVADIEASRPAVVVTVDSWGFTGRVARALKARGSTVPRVHYVAPMVWAWKETRKHAVAARVDHLLTLWPFECAYFSPLGLACTHVGHAVVESGADAGDGPGFRAMHGIPSAAPVLVVLPGSRRTEVGRLLPVFRAAVARLAAERPGLRVVVPTVATVVDTVTAAIADWPVPTTVVRGAAARHDAFAAATAALAASGTVSLELAMADVPHVLAYRVNPLSAALFRALTSLRHAGPVNILMDRAVVPELLQGACTPAALAAAVAPLLDGDAAATRQRDDLKAARHRLVGTEGVAPSDKAAEVIARVLKP
nr:lipid-A-disaccharide synthase [Roseospira goensis]